MSYYDGFCDNVFNLSTCADTSASSDSTSQLSGSEQQVDFNGYQQYATPQQPSQELACEQFVIDDKLPPVALVQMMEEALFTAQVSNFRFCPNVNTGYNEYSSLDPMSIRFTRAQWKSANEAGEQAGSPLFAGITADFFFDMMDAGRVGHVSLRQFHDTFHSLSSTSLSFEERVARAFRFFGGDPATSSIERQPVLGRAMVVLNRLHLRGMQHTSTGDIIRYIGHLFGQRSRLSLQELTTNVTATNASWFLDAMGLFLLVGAAMRGQQLPVGMLPPATTDSLVPTAGTNPVRLPLQFSQCAQQESETLTSEDFLQGAIADDNPSPVPSIQSNSSPSSSPVPSQPTPLSPNMLRKRVFAAAVGPEDGGVPAAVRRAVEAGRNTPSPVPVPSPSGMRSRSVTQSPRMPYLNSPAPSQAASASGEDEKCCHKGNNDCQCKSCVRIRRNRASAREAQRKKKEALEAIGPLRSRCQELQSTVQAQQMEIERLTHLLQQMTAENQRLHSLLRATQSPQPLDHQPDAE